LLPRSAAGGALNLEARSKSVDRAAELILDQFLADVERHVGVLVGDAGGQCGAARLGDDGQHVALPPGLHADGSLDPLAGPVRSQLLGRQVGGARRIDQPSGRLRRARRIARVAQEFEPDEPLVGDVQRRDEDLRRGLVLALEQGDRRDASGERREGQRYDQHPVGTDRRQVCREGALTAGRIARPGWSRAHHAVSTSRWRVKRASRLKSASSWYAQSG
jgi:hypothetical protein